MSKITDMMSEIKTVIAAVPLTSFRNTTGIKISGLGSQSNFAQTNRFREGKLELTSLEPHQFNSGNHRRFVGYVTLTVYYHIGGDYDTVVSYAAEDYEKISKALFDEGVRNEGSKLIPSVTGLLKQSFNLVTERNYGFNSSQPISNGAIYDCVVATSIYKVWPKAETD